MQWQSSKCVLYWNFVKNFFNVKFVENCFWNIFWAIFFQNSQNDKSKDNLQFTILSHLIKFKCDYKIFNVHQICYIIFTWESSTSIFYVVFLVSLIIFWWKWMMLMENFQLKLLLSLFGYMTSICWIFS